MGLALIPGIGSFGGTEMIIALVIILLLFGAKRIPELARGLGSGVREFRQGTREGQIEDKKKDEEEKDEEEKDEEEKDEERKKDEEDLASTEASSEDTADASAQQDASAETDRTEQKQR